nr:MAG TPA: hypothetical protein [Bacteriophage sp.]
MVINFNPKYIPGDIVYNHKKEIIRITSSYLKGTKLFYYRDGDYGWIREDAIAPIPLTPEILEKNEWKSINGKYALKIKNANYVVLEFTEDGIYAYINEKTMLFTIKYIHELQHLLFGLGLNSEMEV